MPREKAELLPKFDNPPVIETVLGVQFKPLVRWQVQHIGLYGARVRSQFPNIEIQPPLPDETERFGDDGRKDIRISLTPMMNPRSWFIGSDAWLVQVQNSRFISNWRKLAKGKYPHYKAFNEHFSKEFTRFCDFLKHEEIGLPELEQVEVSYINHIDDFDNWAEVFPSWASLGEEGFLKKPDAVEIRAVFPIENDRGRLYIRAEPVVRHMDAKEVIQLTLTAKVLVASGSNLDVSNEMRLAHDWVVCGFADFTTGEMHKKWIRKQ